MGLHISRGWRSLGAILEKKYGNQDWFNRIKFYLIDRHYHVQERLLTSFRYVELDPKNALSFSYEYSSLLRDIGGMFGSFLDKFIRSASPSTKGKLNINNYLEFLDSEVDDIEKICAEMEADYDRRYLFPFHGIGKSIPNWWKAYNNVKHTDIEKLQDGGLTNVLYGFASLSILENLVDARAHNKIFRIGLHQDFTVDETILWNNYVFPLG